MFGLYYNTELRDEKTGESFFTVTPKEVTKYTKDGLIRCMGVIGNLRKGTPITFEGTWSDAQNCIIATNIKLATGSQKKNLAMLSFITKDLTDAQMENIANSTLDIFSLLEHEELLTEALKKKKNGKEEAIATILSRLKILKDNEKMMELLGKYEISVDKILHLQKKDIGLEKINKNPYQYLCMVDTSIKAIDEYAVFEAGIKEYDLIRLKGYVSNTMYQTLKNGSTCMELNRLLQSVNYKLQKFGVFKDTNIDLTVLKLCISKLSNLKTVSIDEKYYVYLKRVWEEETKAITHLKRLSEAKTKLHTNIEIEKIEKELSITYAKEQKEAFQLLKTSGVKVLTGPPGSGKTAIIKGLIKSYESLGREVKIAATTGIAARVASSAAGLSAVTVHILLGVAPFGDGVCLKNRNNPLDADFIIIDEVSMLGLGLFSNLLAAVKNGAILLLVGDEEQLQSVEYGNVLHDLICSKAVEVYRLTKIFRQSGLIPMNAYKIKKHRKDLIFDDTFKVLKFSSNEELMTYFKYQVLDKEALYLCPVKKGAVSTKNLNEAFQKQNLNPILFCYGHTTYRLDDKIVFTKTNYDFGYVNGDIGFIKGYQKGVLRVLLGSEYLEVPRECLSDITLAYSITIHKSQGTEAKTVYVILPGNLTYMMSTRLLYTAVTRAKKNIVICFVENLFYEAIENLGETVRVTKLAKRLNPTIDDSYLERKTTKEIEGIQSKLFSSFRNDILRYQKQDICILLSAFIKSRKKEEIGFINENFKLFMELGIFVKCGEVLL